MNADIQGALDQIDNSWRAFVHNGMPMTKAEVKAVLEYGLAMGFKTTNELSDFEINTIIASLKPESDSTSDPVPNQLNLF